MRVAWRLKRCDKTREGVGVAGEEGLGRIVFLEVVYKEMETVWL